MSASTVLRLPRPEQRADFSEFEIDYDRSTETLFWWMKPRGRPCFTSKFLLDVERFERPIAESGGFVIHDGGPRRVWNYVVGSKVAGVFNLGGDISMFMQAILRKDVRALESYATLCISNMFRRMQGFGAEISTYSLIQGRAFGGGFECALAGETLVAERSAVFAFPEVLFNMIPGMGAISLLGRRIGLSRAQEIVMSGQTFTAKDMREMGVIDELVDDQTGEQSVRRIIVDRAKRRNSYRAMSAARKYYMPISRPEMDGIVAVWVAAALRLETRDLRMMARLVRAQDRMLARSEDDAVLEVLYGTPINDAVG